MPLLLALLEPAAGLRILEVGCGGGASLVPIGRLCRPAHLVGLDVDAVSLARAATHLQARDVCAQLVHGDVRRLPFDAGAFDLVFDFGTCYHIAWPVEALREIARVLRPGGKLVTESPLNQWTSHPLRSARNGLPWARVPALVRRARSLMWQVWERAP